MRVLHIGNIANNAYNNAKFLRRKGVEADVLCYDYRHVMAQPEWEDAVFDAQPDEFAPQWEAVDLGNFCRPSWFMQDELLPARRLNRRWFKGQFHLEAFLRHPSLLVWVLAAYRSSRSARSIPAPRLTDFLRTYHVRNEFAAWYREYDLIQAYATEPINAWMFGEGRPYVAFEHGTMRDIPFENSARGRLLSLAYREAGKVFITNPDVITAARRLGLTNFQFIPHPVDETKYCPRQSPLRSRLMDRHQTGLIFFAPSRHNWSLKGNDVLLRAFARFQRETSQNPILILCEWGQEADRTARLVAELGLHARVVWSPPLSKMKLIDYYNAADAVFDQFTIGTFGTVTPEAMACGKPVVLHFDRAMHEWCYSEMPPVLAAQTEDEIFGRMVELGSDPGYRAALGQSSREWVVKHHGWELVADRQIAVYRELLSTKDVPRGARRRCTPAQGR